MGAGKTASTESYGANVPVPAPVPQLQIPTVPAPGQRGPRGLVGRQAYSRVNTGAPQAPDAGAYAQKSIPPTGAEKTSEVSIMTTAARPTIQDMLKMAMAGTSSAAGSAVSRIKVAQEAKRQLENLEEEEGFPPSKEKKTEDEKKEEPKEKVSGAYVLKLASAVEYCAELLEKEGADLAGPYTLTETPVAPGKGPNALEVSESPMPAPVNQKDTGQAIASDQPPLNPPTQKAMPQERGGTQLQNDADSAPADGEPPMSGSTTNYAKVATRIRGAKLAQEETMTEEERKKKEEEQKATEQEKKSSLVHRIRMLKKTAEDAGSPSSISAGPVQQNDQGPPGVLNSSEAGPPAKDKGKVPVGHDATRAFTRADAKATPKAEMKAVLNEPMMSSQTDKVLDVNLSNEGDKKISSARDVTKVAAARALLAKLRREAQN